MPPPTVQEFSSLLEACDGSGFADLASNVVLSGLPYVFRDDPAAWDTLKDQLSTKLGCTPDDVLVIGSAKMGFSLAPRKYGSAFSEQSDIDVIIIDEDMFDRMWHSLLKWHYRRRFKLPPADARWDDERRMDLYWGYFNPTGFSYQGLTRASQLRDAKRVSTAWFNAFQGLGVRPEFAGRRVSGRLYRTSEFAKNYHGHNLRELRRNLFDDQPGADTP